MVNPKLKNAPELVEEIKKALKNLSWGSLEIYVQNKKVTQLTVRKIMKTSLEITEEDDQTLQTPNGSAKRKVDIKTISYE